ncbi:UDP-N-acetylmuramoyl-L-alanine--D-glutamate ligase [Thiopseudomonas denitrificans]|uniref:UDP-N-acetylmuramoylalanine--D-glutamate ligase n=1 Tax=Thiopseudomonas denitrificans TaxID=1501432 RepID=A0A4R6TYA7_9GAMM|nr:UDP-N-acetylmuramoyl-L-alanine--D-glutamate ligase [Thiopseudomonas denitrificans]TDQ38908.1 UDP-N-acetylmuramoylalanine--D-glutamate ligase [Thiopseudomonas denitrificans]
MTQQLQVVVGLGKTGLSLVRHLARQGVPVAAVDTREQPPELTQIRAEFPQVELHCGSLDTPLLQQAQTLYVSPGLALATPQIRREIERGVHISGDVDLFLQHARAPVVAITGSNAKSTVTTLVGLMAEKAGLTVGVGGNIGMPALALLERPAELYVLELSSFQLETISHLQAKAATCLNISADHLDRYRDLQHYTDVKLQVYQEAEWAIINRDDVAAQPQTVAGKQLGFGLSVPHSDNEFGLRDGWLARGSENLLPVAQLKIPGLHNQANALAALALGTAAGLPMAAMLDALREFAGLPHRCQWIADKHGLHWYNDSKATNIGATLAAIEGLADDTHKLVLIAGGDGKGADFTELSAAVRRHCRALVLLGRDAELIRVALADTGVPAVMAATLGEAVAKAAEAGVPGDSVLLAPACASLDMFRNFEERGELFVRAVEGLA